ncbi:MAG: GIY-YIG nuclease family protein [bacterium]|nr:GIY-YIG nuclease family protein [bacterium]
MTKQFFVYIASNKVNTVLYTGVTNNLTRRMYEHKNKLIQGFTSKYNVNKLLYYEIFPTPREAIAAEKKIKAGSRERKIGLIESMNPEHKDLSEEL